MTLQKVNIRPGVNRERTSNSNEGTWFECDKIRFRQGLPEKIGGWVRISANTFIGVCRSIFSWATLTSVNYIGLGTHSKFYISRGGAYYDITPIRATNALTDPYTTVSGSPIVTVADAAGGYVDGDYVTFSGGDDVAGLDLNNEYVITVSGPTPTDFTITASANANASTTGGGSVSAAYQINVGSAAATPSVGWGAGPFGGGPWGEGEATVSLIRLWSQASFGEDLVFTHRVGAIYYWDSSVGTDIRAVLLSSLGGASDVPTVANIVHVSFTSRFVFALGANPLGGVTQDPLLVRWSDQESAVDWTPSAINQAGDIRLSRGSKIVAVIQSRQEILVWTDSSVYSFQYVGAPVVWRTQLLGSNISIMGQNVVSYANGVAYWMGVDHFYKYDGRVQALHCDLQRHIFTSINLTQADQVFSGTLEQFNEIWWFYCSLNSTTVDSYVVYNYVGNIWYYGTMARTAWLDSGIRPYPLAATYNGVLIDHENGIDDSETSTDTAISSFITSAQFDIDDGDRFSFISRVLPDVTFEGSTAASPAVTLSLIPKENSGAGRTTPASEGGAASGAVTRTATSPVEEYTEQIHMRIRGRQVAMKIASEDLGVIWQLGTPQFDIRPDGRR